MNILDGLIMARRMHAKSNTPQPFEPYAFNLGEGIGWIFAIHCPQEVRTFLSKPS